jgi:hypothetical protein
MRALILIGLLAGAPCLAQPAATMPWMTGERLVKMLGNTDPNTVAWKPGGPFRTQAIAAEYMDMANGEFVRGYIQGVHDATEGKDWCWSRKYQPMAHELEFDARHALQRMPAIQLKRNAADLIVEVWRETWPCPAAQRRRQ